MFEPRLALASLSGEADAEWATGGVPYAGLAVMGGIALDDATREAATRMVEGRDRTEFLPPDPIAFVDSQLAALEAAPIEAGFNVRAVEPEPLRRAARVCASHDAILEVNAHCRQDEMCAVGAGESLLRDADRLAEQVRIAAAEGPRVSVKVRAEVPGVSLPELSGTLEEAGADVVHVDAMDSEPVIEAVSEATDAFVIANNGVRDRETAAEYLEYGADAVSVGRPSDDPDVLARVNRAVTELLRAH